MALYSVENLLKSRICDREQSTARMPAYGLDKIINLVAIQVRTSGTKSQTRRPSGAHQNISYDEVNGAFKETT